MAMMFKQLSQVAYAPRIDEQQEAISRQFWELVKGTHLKRWRKGEPIAAMGRRLLVGLWTSGSPRDLELADMLAAKPETEPSDLVIELFDAMEPSDANDIQNYVPGIGKVFHTPIVGLWVDGRMVEKAQGFAGRELVKRVIG